MRAGLTRRIGSDNYVRSRETLADVTYSTNMELVGCCSIETTHQDLWLPHRYFNKVIRTAIMTILYDI